MTERVTGLVEGTKKVRELYKYQSTSISISDVITNPGNGVLNDEGRRRFLEFLGGQTPMGLSVC